MGTQSLRIVVTGLIAQHPWMGGVAWDYVQYVVGLAELGHDVYYVEDSGEWPYAIEGGSTKESWRAHDCAFHVKHLACVMERFGLGDRWAYRYPVKPRWYGMRARKRRDILRSADLLLNISGTLKRPGDYRGVRRLAYVDSDPVFTQVKLAAGRGQRKFQKRVAVHDVHFTFGETLAAAAFGGACRWRPTRQPVVLSQWDSCTPYRDVCSTVMSWTSYPPLKYAGVSYGQKDVEFGRFLQLPRLVRPAAMEVALSRLARPSTLAVALERMKQSALESGVSAVADREDQGVADGGATEMLRHCGWKIVDPLEACVDLDRYRAYVQSSKAEWSVAKNGYVKGKSGWFSCRSACYLAAGRPTIVQNTGFDAVLPVGEGILPFTTLEEAVEAIHQVESHYERHASAARAIANEYFDANKVLQRLLEDAFN